METKKQDITKHNIEVSVIIPTYNESANIEELILRINKTLDEAKINGEIIVVDDNSPDGTGLKVEKLKIQYQNVNLIIRKTQKGLSSAVITGINNAKGNTICIMDADLSHPPEIIPKLIEPIKSGKAELVIASRYITGGKIENWNLKRKIISKVATIFAKLITNLKDPMSGFLAFNKDIINNTNLNPIGYKIGLEIIAKANYKNIIEIPYTFHDRKYGKSKLNLKIIFEYIFQILSLFIIKNELFKKIEKTLDHNSSLLNPIRYISIIYHVNRYIKVSKLIKNEGNLLDIGCGKPSNFMVNGAFLNFIDKKDSYGIDINDIEISKYKFIKADIRNTPFQDKHFDNVVAMEVLEHLSPEDLNKALNEIKRIMKDDAVLIISTPNNSILWKIIWFIWSNIFGRMWKDTHLIKYNEKEWIKVITQHFKVEKIERNFIFDLIIKCTKYSN